MIPEVETMNLTSLIRCALPKVVVISKFNYLLLRPLLIGSMGSAPQGFDQGLAKSRRRRRHNNTGSLHCSNFGLGIALSAGNNGACMAHAASRRRCTASNKANHGLLAAALGLVPQELRRIFLRRSANFADHDDRFSRFVGKKHFQYGDEISALDRVTADAYRGGLTEALLGGLEHRLIGECARPRYDTHHACLENAARHNTNLALAGRHHSRTIRPDQRRFRSAQSSLDPYHVDHRDA